MNLVGKIFIVLIFVMSLLWMGFSVAVYATHTNWKNVVENSEATADMPLGLKHQVDRQKERNQQLKDEVDKLTAELESEVAAKRQALTKLENKRIEVESDLDEEKRKNAALVDEVTEALATLKSTQDEANGLRIEVIGGTKPDGTQVVGLREEIRGARDERNKLFDDVVKLTDQLHQERNAHLALKARMDTLLIDLANARAVLRKHQLPETAVADSDTPPVTDGLIRSVGENQMVEISLGSDDGLRPGHVLHVVRDGGTYLGRIEVAETSPDKAVCKIIPEYLQGAMQRNDRVISQLRK